MVRKQRWIVFVIVFVVLSLAVAGIAAAAQPVRHPLDPLTFEEHWALLEVLQQAGRLDGDTRFSVVTLAEPAKDTVRNWSAGAPIPRAAFAVVRQKEKSFEAVVDLVARRIVSFEELSGVQPNWLTEELGGMVEQVKQHPEFIAALKKRGIEDSTFVDCFTLPPGYFGTAEQKGRRVGHVLCDYAPGVRNLWARHIEGLTAVVDLNTEEVLRIVDDGAAPMPTVSADYDPDSIGPPREVPGPIHVSQPDGPGFELDGHSVSWQKWSFHVRPDRRVGPVVSLVSYSDGDRQRPVMYQGHLAEIFVPYMDPAFAWYVRNFLDAGEFNMGGLTKPLVAGVDCPDHAVYFDMVVAADNGRPQTVAKDLCLFERTAGDPSWRHHTPEDPQSRVRRDLVVRSAAVLGNYDYIFDWVFQQNGSIVVAVGSTGIAEAKVVAQATAGAGTPPAVIGGGGEPTPAAADAPAPAIAPDAYGRYVDRNIVAVNHDHYFSYRLDLDVDGPDNSFLADRLVAKTLPPGHPRRSLWVLEPQVAHREADAKLHMDHSHPALWRVVSSSQKNHVGYPTSYQLMPGMGISTLLSPDDYPRRRAGFIDHQLWVTPYRPNERHAAGDYPTLSEPGQGLPAWTKANRPIEGTDIVLWHTLGMHHVVRAEDWPVMPVMWHSFELRPFDFFDRNPALDLPKEH